jgi:diamine N-acetyltransferase
VRQIIAQGSLVSLALSIPSDRRLVYDWYANSDVTASMAGPPNFPETPAGSYEKFCSEQPAHYFDGAITEAGRCFILQVSGQPAGTIYFNDITERNGIKRVELDMWMGAEAFCGKGYGPDALRALCAFVAGRFGVQHFMMQPSARNPRAIRMYEKVGFVRLDVSLVAAIQEWGRNDYPDSVYMLKTVSAQ